MINIRATQLESFITCPARYRFEEEADPNSDAFKFWTTLHKIIEMYVEGVENQDAIDILLEPRWVKERKMLKSMTETFVDNIKKRELTFVMSEYSFTKKFDDIVLSDNTNPTLQWTFDLLFKDKDWKYIIVDIKTASSAWKQDHIDAVQQRRIYPALAERCNWLHISRFEYWIMKKTLTPGLQEVGYDIEVNNLETVTRFMKQLAEASDSLEFVPNYPNYTCFFCKIKEECRNIRHFLENNNKNGWDSTTN